METPQPLPDQSRQNQEGYQSPYDNPELRAQAGDDFELLHRLVAVDVARHRHEADPANPVYITLLEAMEDELSRYQQAMKDV